MANTSISHLIMFIASLIIASSVAFAMTGSVLDLRNDLGNQGDAVASDLAVDAEIVSDPGSPKSIYNNSSKTVTLLVENTGQKTLPLSKDAIDVLIDGEFANVTNVSEVGSSNTTKWEPGDVMRLQISRSLDSGRHRAKVIVGTGDTDTMAFYVP